MIEVFFFKTQFSLSDFSFDNGIFDKIMILLLNSLSVLFLFCALFFSLFCFFFKNFFSDWNWIPTVEEYYETFQEFEEKETSFSFLRFRFPTYEEFIKTKEEIDSDILGLDLDLDLDLDSSNEADFFLGKSSTPSNSDTDFSSSSQEIEADNYVENEFSSNFIDPEKFPEKVLEESNIKDEKLEEDFDEEEWEEELKMEIKKANRAHGLPSIPEESEFSEIIEDLKPWKIEEKFDYRDAMNELDKVDKIYRGKMRKYDTLNFQKMYAIDLMQSKDSLDSLLSKSFWMCKPKRHDAKLVKAKEFHGDLEMVYVGQLCLSWEFILWQYNKFLNICEKIPQGICRYNEIASKYQHFQVLIQRFMENESFSFEGSRMEYYAKSRLSRRKLLQVPLVQEDKVKDIDNDDDNGGVTIDMIVEILQESIRILWQFIRSDKLTNISNLKCRIGAKLAYESPEHSDSLKEVLSDLRKKERKLKKIICVLKNFKEASDDELYFFCQVDLKLVSRVLNMKRITGEQLSWCHNKLSSISFHNRKIKVEPSLFLFPS